jgi:hypothetical protein
MAAETVIYFSPSLKPCPNRTCGNTVPGHYRKDMKCFMCVFFGHPQVRRAPELKLTRVNRGDRRRPS